MAVRSPRPPRTARMVHRPVRHRDGPSRTDAGRRDGPAWTALTVVEVVLAVTAVLLDLLLPAVVLTVLAGLSLAVRREGPSTLGFHRLSPPGRQLAQVAALRWAGPRWCSCSSCR